MDVMDTIAPIADVSRVKGLRAMKERALRVCDSVVCFGDSDWWYHNRGHVDMQMMRRFARRVPTLYINSLGVRMPSRGQGSMRARRALRKLRSMARFYRDGGEGFGVMSPVFAPVMDGWKARLLRSGLAWQVNTMLDILGMRHPLLWIACPTAAVVMDRVRRAGLVHQLSDCYSALQGERSNATGGLERRLAEAADLIVCSSRMLHDHALREYGKGEYLDHGVDYDLFARAANADSIPEELRCVERPMIGFFGNIDGNTVDKALLDRVIRLRREYQFVLVGSLASDFEELRRHPNVRWIDRQPYHRIPEFGAAFDVCLMPWLQNEWIRHCNPIKLKEYLALGKPIVSTPFPELGRYKALCHVADGPERFALAIDQALQDVGVERVRERQAAAARHTWDAKFDRVVELLAEQGITLHERE